MTSAQTVVTPIKLRLSNAYLLQQGNQAILVDTGSPGEEEVIIEALNQVGVSLEEINLILHTHVHSDHVGSTVALAADTRIPVAFHAADQPLATLGHNGTLKGIGLQGRALSLMLSHNHFPAPSASTFVEDGLRLDGYGIAGYVLHTPGHTPGSISVILDSGAAVVGDILMGGYLGGMLMPTKPGYHFFADDTAQLQASIVRLLSLPVQTWFVGHGGPLDAEQVRKWHSKQERQG